MSDTPETDDAEFPVMTWPSGDNPMVVRSTLARKIERERDNAEGAVYGLVCENERLRDARAKAESGELLLELTIGMMDQDIATIREIITQGGATADILKFLNNPNA